MGNQESRNVMYHGWPSEGLAVIFTPCLRSRGSMSLSSGRVASKHRVVAEAAGNVAAAQRHLADFAPLHLGHEIAEDQLLLHGLGLVENVEDQHHDESDHQPQSEILEKRIHPYSPQSSQPQNPTMMRRFYHDTTRKTTGNMALPAARSPPPNAPPRPTNVAGARPVPRRADSAAGPVGCARRSPARRVAVTGRGRAPVSRCGAGVGSAGHDPDRTPPRRRSG